MTILDDLVPGPPDWRVDWTAIDATLECIRALKGCPQDPVHHAEGDVWIHTRMVVEALAGSGDWRALAAPDRLIVFAGALFHDIGKPARTVVEHGRVTSRGHSPKGESLVRVLLWRMGMPTGVREQIAALVAHHQVPLAFLERDDPLRTAARISLRTRNALLAAVADADARGRICADRERLIEQVALFGAFCAEASCLDRAFAFPSDHSRFMYFRLPERSPHYLAHDDSRAEVVMMCGLPGAGKDTWIKQHLPDWPAVSLDDIRHDLEVAAADAQGPVIVEAKERVRRLLRAGTPFVWNATNLGRATRRYWIDIFTDYGARVRIVHVEAPEMVLRARNRRRRHPVPDRVIDRMLMRWQLPDLTEAPRVDWVSAED